MSMTKEKQTKVIKLYVSFDKIYNNEVSFDDESIVSKGEEDFRILKRVFFVNDENEEVDIMKRLTPEQQEMLLHMYEQG
jgi:hypothetical protein